MNSLRTNRPTSAAWTNVSLDDIYAERIREFAWETWTRNDMIRFGKYEGNWALKTDANINKRIFPIPQFALATNTKVTQNPGY